LSAAGCGGLSASQSVSPASLLIPGLLQADPPPAQPERALPSAPAPEKKLAQL
jgi:hypothetical protein